MHGYLDHDATAPPRPGVAEAMVAALSTVGNPSSVHGAGRAARALLEGARERLAGHFAVSPHRVVFTSGGTEANALALRSAPGRPCLISAVEHASVLANAPGASLLAVDAAGCVRLDALAAWLAIQPGPALVSVMAANNETGVIQPLAAIAAIVHAAGGLLHCDAVQAAGRLWLDLAHTHADLVTVSAHKLGGPVGIGCLVNRTGVALAPLLAGGGQERGQRAGTSPVALACGFAAAVEAIDLAAEQTAALAGRTALEAALMAQGARIVAQAAARLPNTSAVRMPGVKAETQVMAFDLAGFAVSAGAACSSGKVGASHVLAAMGMEPVAAGEVIRVSWGGDTPATVLEDFAAAWVALAGRLGRHLEPAA